MTPHDRRARGQSHRAVVSLASPSGRIKASPPAPGTRYWRISIHDGTGRRIGQTTGGTCRASAERKLSDLDRRYAAHTPAGAHASRGHELLDFHVAQSRPKNQFRPGRPAQWSLSYSSQVRQLQDRYLRPTLDDLPLSAWSTESMYRVLDACPTNYLVTKVRRLLSSVLRLGVANGFLRPDQGSLHLVMVPLRVDRRHTQPLVARTADLTTLLRIDEVPSVNQVGALSRARPPGIDADVWEGAVNLCAYAGLRLGELLALSADDVLGDHEPGLILVRWQLIEPAGIPKRLTAPKNGFARMVAVCQTTPLDFPLRSWLIERAHDAVLERSRGCNAGATVVATPRGAWWSRSNFRSRCFNPAATEAGWERLQWRGPVRRKAGGRWVTVMGDRYDWRHPPHSLRHHFACTARDVWGWTGAELCVNGGWADEAFVLSRYYGSTVDTYRHALRKQDSAANVEGHL